METFCCSQSINCRSRLWFKLIDHVSCYPTYNSETNRINRRHKRFENHSVCFFNARSIQNKLTELSAELLHGSNDIFCINETWLTPNFDDRLLQCDTHNVFRSDRIINGLPKTGGGLLIFCPKSIKAIPISSYCSEALEALAIKFKISSTSCWITLLNAYRPPKYGLGHDFVNQFTTLADDLSLSTQPSIIVGDLNLSGIIWNGPTSTGSTSWEKNFIELCITNSWSQLVNEVTRANNILDIALTNIEHSITALQVLTPFSNSDHCKVSFFLSEKNQDSSTSKSLPLNFPKGDFTSMENILSHIDWEMKFSFLDSVDNKLKSLNETLYQLFANFVPKFTKQKPVKLPRHILKTRNFLSRSYKKLKKGNSTDLDKYKEEIRKYKHVVNEYFLSAEEAVLNSGCSRRFWSYMRRKTRCRPNIPPMRNDGGVVDDDGQKAELFNTYFGSVFQQDNDIDLKLSAPITTSLSDIEFDVVDVYELLSHESNKLSRGPDDIPHIIYKRLAVVLALPLFLIFRECINTGQIPSIWKDATIVPIHKKDDKSCVSNYRPISLTCVSSRIMERLICSKLMLFLSPNNRISDRQYGFLSRRSTTSQLLQTTNDWTAAIDRRETIKVVYLDFQKAFDTIAHPKLLSVLDNNGIRGNLLHWFMSFLSNRTQRVVINSVKSSSIAVTSGVPQGSVVGPLLFLLYINGITKMKLHSQLYLYADDCKLYYSAHPSKSGMTLIDKYLQEDLNTIDQWCKTVQLRLSVSKCQVLNINPPNTLTSSNLFIDGNPLENVTSIRDLGLIVDSKLRFSEHCAAKAMKASNVVNFLFRAFKSKETSFLVGLFKTYVIPLLDYGSVVYSPILTRDIRIIESVQKRFTKRLPEFRGTSFSYPQRLKATGLIPLDIRRSIHDLVETYKIIYGYVDLEFKNFFQLIPLNRATRSNGLKLRVNSFRTEIRKNYFSNRVVKLWNKLPRELVTIGTVHSFREAVTAYQTADLDDPIYQ